MSEPTEQQRAASARVAREMAVAVMSGWQEEALRKIFEKQHLKAVDRWIAAQRDPSIDRPEAIRRLVEIGLKATTARRGKAPR